VDAYQRFPEPSIVNDIGYRGVEVIQIDFAVGVEFVEEVEETKRKSSAWVVPGGGEPLSAEQLDAGRGCETVWSTTFAVCDINGMNAGDIEYCKRGWGGWDVASTTVDVAKVEDGAEVFQRHPFKMFACPTLREVSACV